MRTFNTTSVNLRATLDDVDPLVDASKPVAREAAALHRAAARLCHRRGPDDPRPEEDRPPPARRQRPGRAHPPAECRWAGSPPARWTATAPPGRAPCPSPPTPWWAAFPSWPSSVPTSPRRRSAAGSTTSATPGSSTPTAAWAGSRPPSTCSRPRLLSPAETRCPTLTSPIINPSVGQLESLGLEVDQLRRCPGSNERDPGDGSTPFTDNGTLNCDSRQVPEGP